MTNSSLHCLFPQHSLGTWGQSGTWLQGGYNARPPGRRLEDADLDTQLDLLIWGVREGFQKEVSSWLHPEG